MDFLLISPISGLHQFDVEHHKNKMWKQLAKASKMVYFGKISGLNYKGKTNIIRQDIKFESGKSQGKPIKKDNALCTSLKFLTIHKYYFLDFEKLGWIFLAVLGFWYILFHVPNWDSADKIS